MSDERQSPPKRPMGGSMGGPMGGIGAPGEKAKDFKNTMVRFWDYLEKYKVQIVIVILFAILSSVFSVVGPKLLGKATTKLIDGLIAYYLGTGLLTDFKYIGTIIAWLIVLYTVSSLCSYIQSYIMSKVSMEVTYKLRKSISEKMFKIPLNYYDTRTHGEILSRITNDIDTVSQTLNQSLTQIITSVTSVLGVLVMMLSISWLMTLSAMLVIPLSFGILMVIINKSQVFFKNQQKSIGEINGQVEEMYGGHNIVQAFNGEEDAFINFEKINNELHSSAWKSQFVSSMMMPLMGLIGNFGYVMVSILGGYLAVKKVVDIGDIQAFIQYMRSFMQPISQLASISNTLQSTAAAAERVFEFLDEKEESADIDKTDKAQEFQGNVSFQNVKLWI